MEHMIMELGLGLVLLATDLALGYPINNLSDVFTLGILAFFIMSIKLPRQVKFLLTLLALVIPCRFISFSLSKDASYSI